MPHHGSAQLQLRSTVILHSTVCCNCSAFCARHFVLLVEKVLALHTVLCSAGSSCTSGLRLHLQTNFKTHPDHLCYTSCYTPGSLALLDLAAVELDVNQVTQEVEVVGRHALQVEGQGVGLGEVPRAPAG